MEHPFSASSHKFQQRTKVFAFLIWRLGLVFLLAVAIFLFAFLWLMGPSLLVQAAGPHYVAPSGTDSSNCLVSSPCQTIQQAINNAVNGDEIRVATGTYSEILIINKNLVLQGGFTTTDWFASPDPTQNPTIIDASSSGRVVLVNPSSVVTINGFHITGGDTNNEGGGVFNQGIVL